MFSLIITIISIALVAALAVATIYYGGSAFSSGSGKAQLATAVSQAQQISGAMTLALNDGNIAVPGAAEVVTSLTGTTGTPAATGLAPNYLTQIPTAPGSNAWSIGPSTTGGTFTLTTQVPSGACTAYTNNQAQQSPQYNCSGTAFTYFD